MTPTRSPLLLAAVTALLAPLAGCTSGVYLPWGAPPAADDDDSSVSDDDDIVANDDDATPPPADDDDVTPNPADEDGDGYSSEPDCDDGDADVHPGATELCDGIDNDCDNEVDEGCSSDLTLAVSVDYPSTHDLVSLSVQPIWSMSDLGDWWWDSQTAFQSDHVQWSATDEFEGILGIRLNVTVAEDIDNDGDYDEYSWLCEGHYSSAALDGSVEIELALGSQSWDEDDLQTWSPPGPGNVELGCSALLWFAGSPAITEGHVGS